jgi:hypothetical protein
MSKFARPRDAEGVTNGPKERNSQLTTAIFPITSFHSCSAQQSLLCHSIRECFFFFFYGGSLFVSESNRSAKSAKEIQQITVDTFVPRLQLSNYE